MYSAVEFRVMYSPLKQCVVLQINSDGMYRYAASEWFNRALAALACSGVRGVAIDVWVSHRSLLTT